MNKTLADVLKSAIRHEMSGVHTALPGKVESFDGKKASVKPQLSRRFADDEVLEFPVISNVPVVFPRSEGAGMTFPVKKGDGCLLVFAERSLDEWLSNGRIAAPADSRRFHVSDAVCIIGLYSFASDKVDTENTVVSNSAAQLKIQPDGKVALGTSSIELLELLSNLIAALEQTTVATPMGPQMLSKFLDTTFTQIKTKLGLIKGSI